MPTPKKKSPAKRKVSTAMKYIKSSDPRGRLSDKDLETARRVSKGVKKKVKPNKRGRKQVTAKRSR